jgi:hypothetical protein
MSLLTLAEWLERTEWSIALHESAYGYATVESIHVWALCLFVGFAAMLDLRLLGLTFRRVPVSTLATRLLPWTTLGFAVMVVSGLLLFYAIPVRSYHSIFFRLKLVLLMLAGLNVWLFHSGIYRRVATWDLDVPPPRRVRIAGALSLLLWAAIIFSGRMIAYNWFDCGRTQSELMIFLTDCGGFVDPYAAP